MKPAFIIINIAVNWKNNFWGALRPTKSSIRPPITKNIVEKKIKAKFKDGVLNITIPKAEEVKPSVQQIAIS